jgi:hypothetical protein
MPTPGDSASKPPAAPAAPGRPPAERDAWDDFFASHPKFDSIRKRIDANLSAFDTDLKTLKDAALQQLGEPFARGAVGFLKGFFAIGIGFLIALATLYFLYRDGPTIRAIVMDIIPFSESETLRILEALRSTAFAAIVGGRRGRSAGSRSPSPASRRRCCGGS